MSVEVLTFGCRLNAFESEVIAREATDAGLTDTVVINSCAVTNEAVRQTRQSIRTAQARAARRAGLRHRMRGAGPARDVRGRCRRSIGCSGIERNARPGLARFLTARSQLRHRREDEEIRGLRHHGGARDRTAPARRIRQAAFAGLRRGAERVRPSLHLLHHPLRPRQIALGARGRRGRAGPRAGRRGLSGGGADRRRSSPAMARICLVRRRLGC